MGFLSRIRRMVSGQPPVEGGVDILAPVSGQLVSLENVPDKVFAEKIVGDGIAIEPSGKQLCAPISGTLAKIFENNHAFSIESPHGIELFVHFGVGTVELGGKGFTRLKEEGSQVEAGEPVIELDLKSIKQEIPCVLTPVVVANMEDIASMTQKTGSVTAGKDTIFTVTMQ
ncbi:PTS glucose transporter subunit IIA [Shewanella corallii]|uniref:PTS system glucose-specific EIIA component n=2 Tax=Shewanella TaxID=22 RepID=A0ABT0N6T8_9GAMM|nr:MULTISPECIES: PTS glucose transporter subunit IIA [Shewanella]MCL1037469.1 PTS glucose transporter subunit IIA [Shewanella submarina]MCL2914134.1 PTS glucose transporter subunit IIA [Shewanella corallii]